MQLVSLLIWPIYIPGGTFPVGYNEAQETLILGIGKGIGAWQ